MTDHKKTIHLCSCNGSMALDETRLGQLAAALPEVALQKTDALCRTGAEGWLAQMQGAADDTHHCVACTQEAPLFEALLDSIQGSMQEQDAARPIQFVNLRDYAKPPRAQRLKAEGGSDTLTPKMAALLAAALQPAPTPVQAVEYVSNGALLIVGAADVALDWAERLHDRLDVSVLMTSQRTDDELPPVRRYPVFAGEKVSVKGWLGHFTVSWSEPNPIDLSVCTRCNACVDVCPEGAISNTYQINTDRCQRHDDCVAACGAIGAINFNRGEAIRTEQFDLVLDLSAQAMIRLPHPPQGYFAPGRDLLDQFDAVFKLTEMVGEFEKPRYFDYKANTCAHARNKIEGCSKCIDICSTGAISAKGDGVTIEPHLCMGCGACASACPTGAMRYVFPSMPDSGTRLKTTLAAYARAGGADAVILFHDSKGEDLLHRLGHSEGLPENVIPLGVHDIASVGPDLMLAALCYGAAQIAVLHVSDAPSAYLINLQQQMTLVQRILNGLGYPGNHCTLLEAATPAVLQLSLQHLSDGGVRVPQATFNLFAEKRQTLSFCIDHLQTHAPATAVPAVTEIALPIGAPFGTLTIDTQRCTLCMSCVGACPAKALQDNPELPQLRFIEHNCVQCGICVETCPEQALGKQARLLLTPAARQPRVLNEAQPFHCVRCGVPFGTRAMVDSMLKRLSGHALFAEPAALRRLQMCGDCRVADMMENRHEMSVTPAAMTADTETMPVGGKS